MLTDPETKVNDTIVDIDLSPIRKKKFRIDGDDNRILELNVSDLSIFTRLKDAYPKLEELAGKALEGVDEDTDFEKFADILKEIDADMRKQLDYIFDANVSEICAPSGSMYDPFNGKLRYEHILDVISSLYENNFNAEVKKITKRVDKHTAKYTKKTKK